jgi:hypothetical protein
VALSPGVKWPGREAEQWSPSCAEVKNGGAPWLSVYVIKQRDNFAPPFVLLFLICYYVISIVDTTLWNKKKIVELLYEEILYFKTKKFLISHYPCCTALSLIFCIHSFSDIKSWCWCWSCWPVLSSAGKTDCYRGSFSNCNISK